MKLPEWREAYPDHDHLTDEEVMVEFDIEVGDAPDMVTPALYDINEVLEKICNVLEAMKIPTQGADVLPLLKQIKNGLVSLEVAIKAIDVNVSLPAPVVNIPKASAITFPEPLKEWTFDAIRDGRGYIQTVKARA
jgi:hypothetical protein